MTKDEPILPYEEALIRAFLRAPSPATLRHIRNRLAILSAPLVQVSLQSASNRLS